MLREKQKRAFAKIYKEIFGEELSEADILRLAEQLLNLYRVVYGDPSEDYKDNK